jgi:glycosyltransferase involved in cell wall biosynthesis
VIAAPHPVDAGLFRPLPYRDALRRAAGLDGRFVIGVFGRNTERKQQPRVMMALQQLRARGKADDIIAYFHCQPTNEDPWLSSWNLLSAMAPICFAQIAPGGRVTQGAGG